MDQTQFVTAVGAGLSQDGQIAELRFMHANGTVTPIQFASHTAAPLLLNIEQALGTLFEKQRAMLRGEDPRAFFAIGAKHVKAIQGAMAQGVPVVSFVLDSNVRMDFALEKSAIHDLIEWLREVEALAAKPPPARN